MILRYNRLAYFSASLFSRVELIARRCYRVSNRAELSAGEELLKTVWRRYPKTYNEEFINWVERDIYRLKCRLKENECKIQRLTSQVNK